MASLGAAQAQVGLFSTGLDATGQVLPLGAVDPHYTVTPSVSSGQTYAVNDAEGYPGYWMGPSTTSSWITAAVSGGTASGADPGTVVYTYTTRFDLSGIELASARIDGRVAADNEVTDILINGQSIGFTPWASYSSFATFSINSGFVAGVNSLSFVVTNYSGPAGVRAEVMGEFTSAVPEPGTWALLSGGVLMLALRRLARS